MFLAERCNFIAISGYRHDVSSVYRLSSRQVDNVACCFQKLSNIVFSVRIVPVFMDVSFRIFLVVNCWIFVCLRGRVLEKCGTCRTTHEALFYPLVCQCLPVFDEICRRFINFVRTCISHKTPVVQLIAIAYFADGQTDRQTELRFIIPR